MLCLVLCDSLFASTSHLVASVQCHTCLHFTPYRTCRCLRSYSEKTTKQTMSWPYNPPTSPPAQDAASQAHRPLVEDDDDRDSASGGGFGDAPSQNNENYSFTTPNPSQHYTSATELATPSVLIRGGPDSPPTSPPEPQSSGVGGFGVPHFV